MSYDPSEKQWAFIERLCAERHPRGQAAAAVLRGQRLTRDGAGKVIDALMAMPVLVQAAPVAAADNRGSLPHNRYSGSCVLCGHDVPAQVGTYRRGPSGGWQTLHLPNECPQAAAPAPAEPRKSFSDQVQEIVADVPDGCYAVPSVTGSNDLTFFKIATGKQSGRRYVRQIVGGDDETGNLTTEWIKRAVGAVMTLGINDCLAMFGQEIGQCGFCMQSLTRQYSRTIGYGPDCADRHGLPFDHAAYRASEIIA